MALNREKIVASAQKFIQRGQLDKAIKEFQRIVEEDPKDVRTLLKIGDLFSKKGERDNAIQTYLKVAEFYSEQGFFLKAVAVYKQILKVDPSLIDVNVKLADLYGQLGLGSDALTQYQNVAQYYEKAAQTPKVLQILRKMVELDPANVGIRIKLAELFAKEAQNKEATEEFREAARVLKEQNRMADYAKVGERILFLDPENLALAKELAEMYLKTNDVKRALAKLQVCFKADPRDVPVLEMLASAFLALGQTPKTVSVYRELAKIHADKGEYDKRRQYLKSILELQPDDEETRSELEMKAPAKSGDEERVGAPKADRPAPPAAPGSNTPLKPQEMIAKLLTETDVYVKYGLKDKALEHLKKIFSLAPDNLDAHAKVRDIYLQVGDIDGAVATLMTMSQIAETTGKQDLAEGWLREVVKLEPGHAAASARLQAITPEEAEILDDDAIQDAPEEAPEKTPHEAAEAAPEVHEEDAGVELVVDDEEEEQLPPLPDTGLEEPPGPSAGVSLEVEDGSSEETSVEMPDIPDVPDLAEDRSNPFAGAEPTTSEIGLGEMEDEQDLPQTPELTETPDITPPAISQSVEEDLGIDDDERDGLDDLGTSDDDEDIHTDDLDQSPPSSVSFTPPEPSDAEPETAFGDDLGLPAPDDDEVALEVDAGPEQTPEPIPEPEPPPPPPPVAKVTPPISVQSGEARIDPKPRVQSGESSLVRGTPPAVSVAMEEEKTVPGPVVVSPPPKVEAPAVDVTDELGEAEFFEQQGLEDEAIEVYKNVLKKVPGNEVAVKALTRLGVEIPGAAAATPEPAEKPEGETKPTEGTDKVVPVARTTPEPATPPPATTTPRVATTPATQKAPIAGAAVAKIALKPAAKPAVTTPVVAQTKPPVAPIAAAKSGKHDPIEKAPPKVGGVTKSLLNEDSLGGDGFDLASELADDFADATQSSEQPPEELQFSVEDVLSEFKKGVAATVSEADFATHYDLGIAYKEMGLTDEAIREFEISSRAPEKEVDSLSMVGVCRMELGDHKGAIEAFKKASNSDRISGQQSVAIQYELAVAHAAAGDHDTARSLFTKVAKLDPKFRDAAARAAGAAPPPTDDADMPPPDEPAPGAGTGKKGKISYL